MYFFYAFADNISMRVALLIVSIILVIVLVPFRLKTKISFNALKNQGVIALKLGCIRLFLGRAKFELNQIVVNYANNKTYRTSFTQFKKSNNLVDKFLVNIFDEIQVNTLKVYANIGYKKDACATSLLVGCIDVPMGIMLSLFKNKKPSAKVMSYIYPNFFQNSLFVGVSSSISLNLFIIILCFLKALLKFSGGNKNG